MMGRELLSSCLVSECDRCQDGTLGTLGVLSVIWGGGSEKAQGRRTVA